MMIPSPRGVKVQMTGRSARPQIRTQVGAEMNADHMLKYGAAHLKSACAPDVAARAVGADQIPTCRDPLAIAAGPATRTSTPSEVSR